MNRDDSTLDGERADEPAADLARIPPEGAAPDAAGDAGGRGSSLSLTELVCWMVQHPERREALEASLQSLDSPRGRDHGDRVLPLRGRLLDLCRIELAERSARPEPMDLRDRLRAACGSLQPSVAEAGLELILEIDAGVPQRIEADPVLLERLATLLLSRPISSSNGDDVRGRVQHAKQDIHLGPTPVLRLRVSTTPPGIPDEPLETLRGSPTRRGAIPEEGLGKLIVGICDEMVAVMGGSLVTGTDPKGEPTYSFTVPARPVSAGDER